MNYSELKAIIKREAKNPERSFEESYQKIHKYLQKISQDHLIEITQEIGTIPEDIAHDSTEEKLYAKTTDILLCEILKTFGLNVSVNKERGCSADVFGKSLHDYSFVGDAKAFRLSRTAKNQKDFKVSSIVDWRADKNYAILVCPYYQYPKSSSQIYGQALDGNVCLLSWEHLSFMLKKKIYETKLVNLAPIWNISRNIAANTSVLDKNRFFFGETNRIFCQIINSSLESFREHLKITRQNTIERGNYEINFWYQRIEQIHEYDRQQAIKELLKALKLEEKIKTIQKYLKSLEQESE
jgi:type II restriction enzyme